ncbi:MAG: redox-sensing transcriptional repressor Rex [Bacteroidales bacterium]
MDLPEKSVERISQYRKILLENEKNAKTHIYSHELAAQLHLTPVQVRRDIMLIGYSGTQRKGYVIKDLYARIVEVLNQGMKLNITVIGMGNLGKAITCYFEGKHPSLEIKAGFDNHENKINRIISGIKCYHISELQKKIKELNISIAILTLPPEQAQSVTDKLVMSGIKGVLNFTGVTLNVPPNTYVEDYDMSSSLEKVAYFVNHKS